MKERGIIINSERQRGGAASLVLFCSEVNSTYCPEFEHPV